MVGSGVWGEVRKNDSRGVGTLPHPLEFLQELPTTKWTTDFSFTSLFSQKFLVLSIVHIARSGMTKERLNERTNSHPPPLFYALCLNRFLGKNSRTGCQLLGMPGSFFCQRKLQMRLCYRHFLFNKVWENTRIDLA